MGGKNNICVKCGKSFELIPETGDGSMCQECSALIRLPEKEDAMKELEPGTILHGYEIIRKLGSGGMGTVYLANQKSMQRQIALKVLNPSITKDAAAVEQFLNEVRNTGKLQHPNIVNAFDAGEENGIYFLAMLYIKGDTLDSLLQKNGPLNEIKALEIGIQIAKALDYVWKKYQMFHRDIKPGNFMLNEDGSAMLMDMGIAQKIGDSCGEEESIEGSPYYMSPEQIQGKPLSWTTDMYSLGASLYQLIIGVPPYDEKSIDDILKKHCLADFPEPSVRKPGCKISPETVALLKQMMNKDPGKRFSSWEDFIKDAKKIVDLLKEIEKNPGKRLEIDAVAAAEAARNKADRKKKTIIFSLLAVAVVLLTVLTVCFFSLTGQNADRAADCEKRLNETFQKFKKNPAIYNDMRAVLDEAVLCARKNGVPTELSKKLKTESARMLKDVKTTYNLYKNFENFSADYNADVAKVKSSVNAMLKGAGLSLESIESAAGLLSVLEDRPGKYVAATPVQQATLQRIRSEISVLKESLKKCRLKLAQLEEDKAMAEIRRASQMDESQSNQAAQRANAEFAKKEAEALRQAASARQSRMPVTIQAEKQAVEKKQENTKFLSAISAENARVRSAFLKAFADVDLAGAAGISISPEVLAIPASSTSIANALERLKMEYMYLHRIAVDANDVWIQFQDLSNVNINRNTSLRPTKINEGLKVNSLQLDKIRGGIAYFVESRSNPDKFVYLWMPDKEKLAKNFINRKKLYQKSSAFYFALGLYALAYNEWDVNSRPQMIALAKEIVKLQYQTAKKRNDIRVLNRLIQDYRGSSVMSDIF